MIIFETELTALLRYIPDLAPFIGTGKDARIYHIKTPDQNVLPKITFKRVSHMPEKSLSGVTGLSKDRITIECWAEDPTTAVTMRAIIEDYLLVYRGDVNAPIRDFQPAGICDADQGAGDTRNFRAFQDFYVWIAQPRREYIR